MYEIIHEFAGHGDCIAEFDTLQEATQGFHKIVREWGEVNPQSYYLELRYYDEVEGDVTEEEILLHELTSPDTWED
jgi:hypothetical protein